MSTSSLCFYLKHFGLPGVLSTWWGAAGTCDASGLKESSWSLLHGWCQGCLHVHWYLFLIWVPAPASFITPGQTKWYGDRCTQSLLNHGLWGCSTILLIILWRTTGCSCCSMMWWYWQVINWKQQIIYILICVAWVLSETKAKDQFWASSTGTKMFWNCNSIDMVQCIYLTFIISVIPLIIRGMWAGRATTTTPKTDAPPTAPAILTPPAWALSQITQAWAEI